VAKIATLTETFATQDTTKWTGWGTDVFLSTGRLGLNATAAYPRLSASGVWDLTASSITYELVQPPNVGAGSTQVFGELTLDANNKIQFLWENNSVITRVIIAGAASDGTPVTYNATSHRWWRISESGGTVTWATSPDAVTWTTRRTLAAPFTLTSLTVGFYAGYWGTETTPGSALIDNVNTTGAASGAVALTGTGTLTVSGGAPTSYRMYSGSSPSTAGNVDSAVDLAVEFYVTSAANLTEIRWWQPTTNANTSVRQAALYLVSNQSQVAAATSAAPTGTGWQTLSFASPVALTANTRYRAVVLHPGGGYSVAGNYFTSGANEVNGPLVIPKVANVADGKQGSFIYSGSLVYPTGSFNDTNYWVDVTVAVAAAVVGGSVALAATGTLIVAGAGPSQALSGTASLSATGTFTTGRIGGPMTVTVATFPRAGMARISIDFTSSTNAAATATVVANVDDGSTYVVRGGGPVILSGKIGVIDDFEVPLDMGVIYTATANGGDVLSSGTVTIGSSQAFGQPTSWLKDPSIPARNVPVQLGGTLELSYPARMGVFDVIGKSNAVAVAGVRGAARFRLTLATLNPASINDLRTILLSGNVLLLQTPAGYKLGNLYIAVNDVTEQYPTRVLRMSARYWQLDVVEVDRPIGAYISALNTWAVATSIYNTWGTMAAQPWLTVMQGADPNATGSDLFVDPVYGGTVI
jgi:hypothetical protein